MTDLRQPDLAGRRHVESITTGDTATPGGAAEPGKCKCVDCGLGYNDPGFCDLVVPDDVWRRISPTGDDGGILCPICLTRRIAKLNLDRPVAALFFGNAAVILEATAAPPETAALVGELRRELREFQDAPLRDVRQADRDRLVKLANDAADALAASRGEARVTAKEEMMNNPVVCTDCGETGHLAGSPAADRQHRATMSWTPAAFKARTAAQRAEAVREFARAEFEKRTPGGCRLLSVGRQEECGCLLCAADRFLAAGGTPDQEGA